MSNKIKQLLSDTFIFAIGNMFSKLMLFFLMPLYTTVLTPQQYGNVDLLNNAVELFLPIATLSITDAVFRFAIDEDIDKREVFNVGVNILLKSFLIVTIITVIASIFIDYGFFYYFLALYITHAIRQLFANFTRGIGRVKSFALSGIFNTLFLVIFSLGFLLWMDIGVKGYLLAIILSNIVASLYLFFTVKIYMYCEFSKVNSIILKQMLIFSLPNIVNMLSWWFNNTSSRYIISGFCGVGIAGLFAAASKLPSIINLLATIFQQAWQFAASKESKNQKKGEFFNSVFNIYSSFVVVAGSVIIMMSSMISNLVLKGAFYQAQIYVPSLLVIAILGCYSSYFGTFYLAAKKNIMGMGTTLIGASINIIGCFIFIPIIGVFGAIVSNFVSFLTIVIIRIVNTEKFSEVKVKWIVFWANLVLLVVQAIIKTLMDVNVTKYQVAILLLLIVLNLYSCKDEYKMFLKSRKQI